jgi:exopolysaccharide biosynthesis polyprenyl glycosylphosphotransferase
MGIYRKSESIWLFVGDAAVFFLSLFLTLFIRYGTLPTSGLFFRHLGPFSIVFAVSFFVFFVAGLYEKHTLILKSKLPGKILTAQTTNVIIAVLFFYLIPYFGIAPKTNLFIYLILSSIFLIVWRFYGPRLLSHNKTQKGLLIASGEEMRELWDEVNKNPRYNLFFVSTVDLGKIDNIDFQREIIERVYGENINVIVIDTKDGKVEPVLPHLYNLIFSHIRFIDMHKVYEEIFDKVPMSLVKESWFLENISSTAKVAYDALKRITDLVLSLALGLASLVLYPFIALAVKLDDGGAIFFRQTRVGQNNKPISIIKFRSMSVLEDERLVGDDELRVTKVGGFLRKTRLDELPQLWNVLKGDISLIGPRPELPKLAKQYEEDVPYYNIRHLVKPGLSGWSQLYFEDAPYFGPDKDKTRSKLSYDLYYLKNRSFWLDIKIALKTAKVFFSRTGK